MSVRDARELLASHAQLLSEFGKPEVAQALNDLAAALLAKENFSEDEFLSAIADALQMTPEDVTRKSFLTRLKHAERGEESVEQIKSELNSLPNDALYKIADEYIGFVQSWKSKRKAIEEIASTVVGRALQHQKMKIVEQTKFW